MTNISKRDINIHKTHLEPEIAVDFKRFLKRVAQCFRQIYCYETT